MEKELEEKNEKKNENEKKEEYEIINNEKTSKNESADEKLNPNISSNHSNKIKNITNNINSNINSNSKEESNKNIINNEFSNEIDNENKNNIDTNINKINSFADNIIQNINELNLNIQNEEKLLKNENINNSNENNIDNNDLDINKNDWEKNQNTNKLILEEEDNISINNIEIEKEYSIENLDETNNKENDKDIVEEIKLDTFKNKEDNLNDENDNDLINYKNVSDSEKVQKIDEKKEDDLNNELNTDLIKKIIKTKDDGNEVLELYSYEGNENNNKNNDNENENEEYFINQNIINDQNNKEINDNNQTDSKINEKDDFQKFKIENENVIEKENEINLNKDLKNTDIIGATIFKKYNKDINLESNGDNIMNNDQENKTKEHLEKDLSNQKEVTEQLQFLKSQEGDNNTTNKINSTNKNIKEGKEYNTKPIKQEEAIKRRIYSKNKKKIPYRKLQINSINKSKNKNDLQLTFENNNNNNKKDCFFEKYKTLEMTENNINKINSRKSFNINNDSNSNNIKIKNKTEKYYKTKFISYNNYINFFHKTSSKSKDKKNNLSKIEGNKSLLNNKPQKNNDFSYDAFVYQKRNTKNNDYYMASTSGIYSKKGKLRRKTFGKSDSNPRENKYQENNLYKNFREPKINININQIYTPINYSKNISISSQNKLKSNNYIKNINYVLESNDNNYKYNNNYANYQINKSNNLNLFNSKTSKSYKNKMRIMYKNNNMDLSSDNMYQNEFIENMNNNININYFKKNNINFSYKRREDIYNSMKSFHKNNQIIQTSPYIKKNLNIKNKLNMNEEYYNANPNNIEIYEDNNYDNNYYRDSIIKGINIDIEDLLILEEKLYEIIYFLKSIKNVKNQCYDFFNFLLYSSIIKLDKVYKNEKIIQIIKFCINLELLSVILCYEFSFDERIMNKTYILLLEILEINRNSLIYICENILKLSKQQYQKDIWIQLLNKFVFDSTNENKKHYDKGLPFYESINSNNDKLTKKIKEILYNYRTEKSLSISSLLKKIDQKNYEQINDFFHEYIFRKEKDSNSNNYKINQIRPPFILSKRKKKFTLILSLEETLIHLQEINYNQCSLKIRPYLFDFLESVKPYYELILFTSKTQYYTNPIMNIIQRNVNYFDFVFYREHCILIGNDYIKDLTRIGRSLDSTIIVDNLPQSFKLQKENGIFIKSFWAQDPNDKALYYLIPILINIALEEIDVRDGLEKYKEEIVSQITSNLYDYNFRY